MDEKFVSDKQKYLSGNFAGLSIYSPLKYTGLQKEKLKLYMYKKFKRITSTKLRRQGVNLKKMVAGMA